MEGTVHPALASLQGLQAIDLSKNALSGRIPDSFDGAGVLPLLTDLNLSTNQLSGVPAKLGTNGATSRNSRP